MGGGAILQSVSVGFLLFLLAAFGPVASCQTSPEQSPSPPAAQSAAGRDADPTQPVIWSFREEYYDLKNGAWSAVSLFRADKVVLKERLRSQSKRGMILRADIPVPVTNIGGATQGGLGDIYGQLVLVPVVRRQFVFGAGSGFVLPTATSPYLGAGKFIVAPIAGGIWRFPPKGFFLLKLQDFISVAGDDSRADVHYFAATPTLVLIFKRRSWILLENESKTNFEASSDTSFKSSFEFGRMLTRRLGVWIRPEVPWGPHREGVFYLKTGIFYAR